MIRFFGFEIRYSSSPIDWRTRILKSEMTLGKEVFYHNIDHTREARELHNEAKRSCFILQSGSGAMLHRQAEREMR